MLCVILHKISKTTQNKQKNMKKTTDTTNNDRLLAWLSTIPVGILPEIREQIMRDCGITRYVLSYWLSGRTKIPYLAMQKIEEIAGKRIFEY